MDPINENKQAIVIYAGGFKPPTSGHFGVLKQALKAFPEVDDVRVYIGSSVRDGIDQAQSLLIWDIYAKYLPIKVQFEPISGSPIKSIIDLAKENPDTTIYFISGTRSGSEEDSKDLSSKLRIQDKYDNIQIKNFEDDSSISGTKARKARSNRDEFFKYLPKELSDEEKEEVFNIVGTLKENQSTPNLGYRAGKFNPSSPAERLKDRGIGLVNSKVGLLGTGYYFMGNLENAKELQAKLNYDGVSQIDLSSYKLFRPKDAEGFYENIKALTFYLNGLTREELNNSETRDNINDAISAFAEYLNLPENKVQSIFEGYLNDIFNKRDGDLLSNRLLFNYDGIDLRDTPYDDFGAGSLIFNGKLKPNTYQSVQTLNENASYSKDIDYKQYIAKLTKHMLDKGMNIVPLPKVVFKHGDSENAREFLGKTAYYDPNTQTIVLYTEGRHPKDIVRSFSHEMIHHKQNLEGRLGDIQTTNTQEDDRLNDLEKEANLNGTMTFRNWTDSLDESNKPYKHKYGFDDKLGKDPFGLNAYARELALGLEEEIEEGRKKKKDPKKGTGKKPKGSGRRLYTDEDPSDTVKVKFSTRQDIVDTLNKVSFKSKSHARQSQIINLIHQRVRAAYNRAKKPEVKKRLKTALDYITKRKEASKKKTQRLNKQKKSVKEFLLEVIPTDVINSFNIQDTLVQDVWDGEKLKPEVREKLLEIAQDFFESLDLPENVKLKDIKLTGSIANYNWSKFSDFDLHLVLDFSDVDDDEEFVRNYFMAKKSIWNDTHDITIYGFPVEVYVENEGESHTASGLYSILNDEWIVIPKKKEVMIDKDDISTKAQDYISQTEDVQDLYDEGKYEEVITKVDKIKERLKNMRSSGLEKGGEYSVENLAFKVLRRADIIGQLNDLKSKSYDTMMTIKEGDTYEKMAAKGKKSGNLKQGTVRKRLGIPKDEKIPLSTINKEIARLKKMDKDPDKKGAQLGDKNQKYYKALNLAKTLKTTTNVDENLDAEAKPEMSFEERLDYYKDYYTNVSPSTFDIVTEDNTIVIGGLDKPYPADFNDAKDTRQVPVNENVPDAEDDGKAAPYGSGYEKLDENPLSEETEEVKYKIYSDMDGVIVDFDARFQELSGGFIPRDYESKYGVDAFWDLIDNQVGVPFFAEAPWMSDGKVYWEYIEKYNPKLLSAPSRNNESRLGKRKWVENNIPGTELILAYASNKKDYADSKSILIDDRPKNIKQWIEAGGIGILHTSAQNTIKELKKLGL